MSFTIVQYNAPVLRKKGEKVTAFDAALGKFAAEMIETMYEAQGIGLAAQQVGRTIQLCVMDLTRAETDFTWELDGAKPPLDLFMPLVVANPRLTVNPGSDETAFEEGCLSFPKVRGEVIRPDSITVNFQDERGVPHILRCDGLLARCMQHEADHLNGVLFIDRMTKKVRSTIEAAVKDLAKSRRASAKS